MKREVRVYRALLALYPPSFRERHGGPMVRAFRDRCREVKGSGFRKMAEFWAATLMDVVTNAAGAWVESWRGRRDARDPGGHEARWVGRTGGGGGGMDALWKDLGYALRSVRRSPGFAAVAVLTIALGIGANTAIFSVVEAVLLRPLPYDEPEELTTLWLELRQRDVYDYPFSPPHLKDIREQVEAFEDVAGVFTFPQAVSGGGEPVQVSTGFVTANFFRVLKVEPEVGRLFLPEDSDPGRTDPDAASNAPPPPPTAVVLSHSFWRQRYGGDPAIVGTTMEIGGARPTVVGVLPADFQFLMPPETGLAGQVAVWIANRIDFDTAPRNNMFLTPVARLAEGATVSQAQAEVEAVSARIREQYPGSADADLHFRVEPLHEDLTRGVRPVILALLGAVGFLLLIACANVSNLLLVRATTREQELAVRAAVGGSRERLVRQMLLESLVLGVLGGALGLLVALGGIELLLLLQPEDLPRMEGVALNGTVLGFTVLVAVGAALIFGTAPALQGTGKDLSRALTERSRGVGGGGRRLLQKGVVVVEVALSLVLLVGAGLMVRSFVELNRIDPGFRPDGVLTFGLNLPFQRYNTVESRYRFSVDFHQRLGALPGVREAGGVFPLPLTDPRFSGRYGLMEAMDDPDLYKQADFHGVMPGYFRAMGTRLLAGRAFTYADLSDSADVVVIDRKLAQSLWPDEPVGAAVGRGIAVRAVTPEAQRVEVVGVVEHQRHPTIDREGRQKVYFHDRWLGSFGILTWVLRTDGDPMALVEPVRAELAALDPALPLAEVRPMNGYVKESMAPTRFALVLIGVFAVAALILASVGLYGVLAFTVRLRTSEIGVRMAFGASGGSILGMVFRQGMGLVGIGLAVGLVLAVFATRAMASLLVGVAPTDPLTYGAISLLFLAVAGAACLIPALRAVRLDPVGALRRE